MELHQYSIPSYINSQYLRAMILIADSGSTKTDWVLTDRSTGERKYFQTAGFNPMVQQPEFIHGEIEKSLDLLEYSQQVKDIKFFGSGCSSSSRKSVMVNILTSFFPNAEIVVDHDMNGAVIAACKGQPGFACIIGTGSNAVLFDGESIIEPKGSLGIGYILGDEASGAFIGKILLRDFIYKIMPDEMQDYLKTHYHLHKDDILENVYKKPNANTYMAGFTKILTPFRETEYVQQLLTYAFSEFFKYNILSFDNYQQYPVNFIGSIAFNFEKELRATAETYDITIGSITNKPVDSIVDFFV